MSVGSVDPVSDVVNGGITSRGSAGQFSGLDDGSSSLLDDGDEVVVDPVLFQLDVLAIDGEVVGIGVHGG